MNNYTYHEISVGQTETFQVAITADMMKMFLAITGDSNPLHCDAGYAKANGYPAQVVYGMLTAAMYSTLAGVYLPGERSLLYSVNTQLRSPVYVGDTLTITGTVSEKQDTFQIIFVKAHIKNQDQKKVSKAVLEIGVRK